MAVDLELLIQTVIVSLFAGIGSAFGNWIYYSHLLKEIKQGIRRVNGHRKKKRKERFSIVGGMDIK